MSESLVYAISTKGVMKIDQFNEILNIILPAEESPDQIVDVNRRRQVARLLDSLGYCEFDYNARTVYMCPPCLVLLPVQGLPKAVLTGARTPVLESKIKAAVKKRKDRATCILADQKNQRNSITASILIEAIDTGTIKEIAEEAGINSKLERPVAWDLINFSSSVEEVKALLSFERRQEPNWLRQEFILNTLSFSKRNTTEASEYKLVSYRNPTDQQFQHWLWEGENVSEVERDWGRYLVLNRAGINVLLYDEDNYKLAVPVTIPLPCLIARAVVMCSSIGPLSARTGKEKLGDIPLSHPLHIYCGVPPVIARLIAEKLGQKIILTGLENKQNGVTYD